jgi:hypothetical protein
MGPLISTTDPCIVPPPAYKDRWNEVLADFYAKRGKAVALEPLLRFSQTYIFLTAEEISAIQSARRTLPLREPRQGAVPQAQLDPKLQGIREIVFLSDVFFSKDRTLALTGIATWCGGLCGSARWKIFEKSPSDDWVPERPEKECVVDA